MPEFVEQLAVDIKASSRKLKQVGGDWDVVIVGAGPAGAMAARSLAMTGASVLLVDKAQFPRHKVCGCCLSAQALSLEQAGLGQLPHLLGAVKLSQLVVSGLKDELVFDLPGSLSVSRESFDSSLIMEAIRAGATFMPGTTARVPTCLSDSVDVILRSEEEQAAVLCRIVIIADGLAGTSVQDQELHCKVASKSKIGTGAISMAAPEFYRAGRIYMCYGSGGYVGLVRLEDMRTDIAAAFDPAFLRRYEGPAAAVSQMLTAAGWPVPGDVDELNWKGTVPLTRKRKKLSSRRLFVIGDSAGYVEPFTGEGIAWAMASAQAVVPLVQEALVAWKPSMEHRWARQHRLIVGNRQIPTRFIAGLLRHRHLTDLSCALLRLMPNLAPPIVQLVCKPTAKEQRQWRQS